MDRAEISVKLTFGTLFDTPVVLGQMFPVETQDTQALFGRVTLSAPKIGAIHIPMRLVFEKKAIGHVPPALVFPLPLDVLYIGYTRLAALGHTEIAHFPTLFT